MVKNNKRIIFPTGFQRRICPSQLFTSFGYIHNMFENINRPEGGYNNWVFYIIW